MKNLRISLPIFILFSLSTPQTKAMARFMQFARTGFNYFLVSQARGTSVSQLGTMFRPTGFVRAFQTPSRTPQATLGQRALNQQSISTLHTTALGASQTLPSQRAAFSTSGAHQSIFSGLRNIFGTNLNQILVSNDVSKFRELLRENPEHYAKQFAELVTEDNFKKIPLNKLSEIIQVYPDAAKKWTQLVTEDNFKTIPLNILSKIIQVYPDAAKKWTPVVVKNTKYLMDRGGHDILETIAAHDPEATVESMTWDILNGCRFEPRSYYHFYMKIFSYPQAKEQFVAYADSHFSSFLQSFEGMTILKTMIVDKEEHPISIFTKHCIEHFGTMVKSEIGKAILLAYAKESPAIRKLFEQNFDAAIKSGDDMLAPLAKRAFYRLLFNDTVLPTETHLALHYDVIARTFPMLNNPLVKEPLHKVIQDVMNLEQQHSGNYHTFVHAQRWPYHLLEMVYRNLWEIKNNRKLENFRFAHTKDYRPKTKQKVDHAHIIEKGRNGFYDIETRDKQLFLNANLFGNTTNLGSCTLGYFIGNENVSDVKVSIDAIFAKFGQYAVYEKYKSEFDALEQEHEALNKKKCGNILFYAIPKEKINDCVALVLPGGYKTTALINGKETGDVSVILDALTTNPHNVTQQDIKEFTLSMTDQGGMNPDSGIKVFDVNTADANELAAWKAKFDALMAKVAEDIKK